MVTERGGSWVLSPNLRIQLELWHGPDGTNGLLHSTPIAYANTTVQQWVTASDAALGRRDDAAITASLATLRIAERT